jgi:hypothetical protein
LAYLEPSPLLILPMPVSAMQPIHISKWLRDLSGDRPAVGPTRWVQHTPSVMVCTAAVLVIWGKKQGSVDLAVCFTLAQPLKRHHPVCPSQLTNTVLSCARLYPNSLLLLPSSHLNLVLTLCLPPAGSCGHAVCRSCMTSALLHAFKLQQLPLRCPMPHCKAQLQLQPAVQLLEQQVPGSSALAAKVGCNACLDTC